MNMNINQLCLVVVLCLFVPSCFSQGSNILFNNLALTVVPASYGVTLSPVNFNDPTQEWVIEGEYITSQYQNLVLDITHNNDYSGATVGVYPKKTPSAANQLWTVNSNNSIQSHRAANYFLRPVFEASPASNYVVVTYQAPVLASIQAPPSASPTSAANSVAYGRGLSYAYDEVVASFTIQAKDIYGYNRTVGGDTFVVSIEPTLISVNVTDNGNGKYTVSYLVDYSYQISISVVYGSAPIAGSPFVVLVDDVDTYVIFNYANQLVLSANTSAALQYNPARANPFLSANINEVDLTDPYINWALQYQSISSTFGGYFFVNAATGLCLDANYVSPYNPEFPDPFMYECSYSKPVVNQLFGYSVNVELYSVSIQSVYNGKALDGDLTSVASYDPAYPNPFFSTVSDATSQQWLSIPGIYEPNK